MSNKFLDQFGKIFIKQVRDHTIADWDAYLDGIRKSPAGPMVNAAIAKMSESEREAISVVLPGIVDTVLHNVLFLVESEERIKLTISTDDDESVSLAEISDGLAGELPSKNGWIAKFSSERHQEGR